MAIPLRKWVSVGGEAAVRADAQRNRRLILDAAATLFAEQGLGAPVQKIALRAGVSTGTVSRHFPTKEDLFEAILSRGMDELVAYSVEQRSNNSPGPAFFAVFDAVIVAGAADRGLAQQLSAAMGDSQRRLLGPSVQALCDQLEGSLADAQTAGVVRPELALEDVEALMAACMSRPATVTAMTAVLRRGLLAEP